MILLDNVRPIFGFAFSIIQLIENAGLIFTTLLLYCCSISVGVASAVRTTATVVKENSVKSV